MLGSNKNIELGFDNIAIIGGGRWARILSEVVCKIVPQSNFSVHSLNNSKGMRAWVSDRGLNSRIVVSSFLPSFPPNTSNAIIVANAARDHEKTVEWALEEGYSVLVEKPLCLNLISAQRLATLAFTKNIYLATAHVFLFASYVDAFAKLVVEENEIESIHVLWMDPKVESRYGEMKGYDSSLPVYADWLPHILSILGTFMPTPANLAKNIGFRAGGAHLNIDVNYDHIPCEIELVRNGKRRQRIVEVITRQKNIILDFSLEPGVIYNDGSLLCGDLNWSHDEKPVAKMLKSFLASSDADVRDDRLDLSIGLNANRVIDEVTVIYQNALRSWLNLRFANYQNDIGNDLEYALTEMLQQLHPNLTTPIDQRVNYVYQNLKYELDKLLEDNTDGVEAAIIKVANEGMSFDFRENG